MPMAGWSEVVVVIEVGDEFGLASATVMSPAYRSSTSMRAVGTWPPFRINLQLRWDLYHAVRSEARQLTEVRGCGLAS